MIRGFYNEGKGLHKWGTRAARLAGDTGDVFAGNPRKRDASGRPQKREWEKSWFKNAGQVLAAAAAVVTAAAAGAAGVATLAQSSTATVVAAVSTDFINTP
jgi:hypothetical protein